MVLLVHKSLGRYFPRLTLRQGRCTVQQQSCVLHRYRRQSHGGFFTANQFLLRSGSLTSPAIDAAPLLVFSRRKIFSLVYRSLEYLDLHTPNPRHVFPPRSLCALGSALSVYRRHLSDHFSPDDIGGRAPAQDACPLPLTSGPAM